MLFDPDNPLMTARQLAALWGVTTATVRNWEKLGMASSGADAEGVKVWQKRAAEAWRAEHRPPGEHGGIHGGKREGAGKKAEASGIGHRASGSEGSDAQCPVPGASLPNLAGLKLDTPGEIFAAFRAGTLTQAKAKTLKDATQAAASRMDLDVKEKKLMDAAAVEGAWGRHLQNVRRRFEAITRTATPRLLTALGLGPEHGAAVRGVLKGEVDVVLESLFRDAFGEEPPAPESEPQRQSGGGDTEEEEEGEGV